MSCKVYKQFIAPESEKQDYTSIIASLECLHLGLSCIETGSTDPSPPFDPQLMPLFIAIIMLEAWRGSFTQMS